MSITNLLVKGKTAEALQLLKATNLSLVQNKILHAKILLEELNFIECEVILNELQADEKSEIDNAEVLITYATALMMEFKNKDAIAKLDKLDTINLPPNNLTAIRIFTQKNWVRGVLEWRKGNIEQAQKFAEQAVIISDPYVLDDLLIAFYYAHAVNLIGICHSLAGKLESAIEYYERSLEIKRYIGNKKLIAATLNNLGVDYKNLGEYNKALLYLKETLNIREELHDTQGQAYCLNNLGELYRERGQLELALKYTLHSIEYTHQLVGKPGLAKRLSYAGLIYFEMGKWEKAETLLLDAYKLSDGNAIDKSEILFNIIILCTAKHQKIDLNHKYFTQLQNLAQQNTSRLVQHRYKYVQAMLLARIPRFHEQAQAQDILQDLLADEVVDIKITLFTAILLSELLLKELKIYNDEVIFMEIKKIIKRLEKLGDAENAYPIILHAWILKSKLLLIDNQFNDALNLLQKTSEVAESKKLAIIADLAKNEMKLIETNFQQLTTTIENNKSLYEKIQNVKFEEYVVAITHLRQQQKY